MPFKLPGSSPVDLLKVEDLSEAGLPSIVTLLVPLSRSALWAMLG